MGILKTYHVSSYVSPLHFDDVNFDILKNVDKSGYEFIQISYILALFSFRSKLIYICIIILLSSLNGTRSFLSSWYCISIKKWTFSRFESLNSSPMELVISSTDSEHPCWSGVLPVRLAIRWDAATVPAGQPSQTHLGCRRNNHDTCIAYFTTTWNLELFVARVLWRMLRGVNCPAEEWRIRVFQAERSGMRPSEVSEKFARVFPFSRYMYALYISKTHLNTSRVIRLSLLEGFLIRTSGII